MPNRKVEVQLVGVVALAIVVAGAGAAEFAAQARSLSPALAKVLLHQILVGVADGKLGFGHNGPPTPALQLAWLGPVSAAEALSFHFMRPSMGPLAAITVLRSFQVAFHQLGAPILYLAARKRDVDRMTAMLLAAAYALQPMVLAKLSHDTLLPASTLLVLAYAGWTFRRRWLEAVSLVLAVQIHPLNGVGVLLWLAARSRSAERPERRRLTWLMLALGAIWSVELSGLVLPRLLWPGQPTLAVWFASNLQEGQFALRALLTRFARNAGNVCLLLATAPFFLFEPRRAWVLGFDASYYLFGIAGLDHGLIPSTAGLMFVLSSEALAPTTLPRSLRVALLSASGLLCSILLFVWDSRAFARQMLAPPSPPPSAREVGEAALRLPKGRRLLADPTLVPALYGRVPNLEPYADRDGFVATVDDRPTTVLLAPQRLSAPLSAWPPGFENVLVPVRSRALFARLAQRADAGNLKRIARTETVEILDSEVGEPVKSEQLLGLLAPH